MSYKLKLLVSIGIALLVPTQASALSLLDTTPTTNLLVRSTDSPFVIKEPAKDSTTPKVVEKVPKIMTYTVQEGDSLTSIAEQFNTTWQRLWDKNTQLHNQDIINVGDVVTIPTESESLQDRPAIYAPVSSSEPLYGTIAQKTSNYSSNGYAWGNCTWYVKNVKPDIGGYWGDAGYSWLVNASASGFTVSSIPVAGSIGVQVGHVVVVTSVNGNGTVNLSEMNYNGGLGVVHYDTRSISSFIGFIYA